MFGEQWGSHRTGAWTHLSHEGSPLRPFLYCCAEEFSGVKWLFPLSLVCFFMPFSFEPIGTIHSCFKDKFGVPRQPGLVPSARGTLELFAPYNRAEAWTGVEGFSHLWIQFLFHQCIRDEPGLTVRPPRLGGNQRLGVFATRSTFRPNALGLSVVALERLECVADKVTLHLRGLDLIEGTPVLDVKPYIPYVDAIPQARAGFAQAPPARQLNVSFSRVAMAQLAHWQSKWPALEALVVEVIELDPRPAYLRRRESSEGGASRSFALRLYDLDIRWQCEGVEAVVTEILPV